MQGWLLRRRTAIGLTLLAALALGGSTACIDLLLLANQNDEPTPADLEGYWLSVERVSEKEAANSKADADFWYLERIDAGEDDFYQYNIYHACDLDTPIGLAVSATDGTFVWSDDDNMLPGVVTGTHELAGDIYVDGAAWEAHRIEQPNCDALAEDGGLLVAHQQVEHKVEASDSKSTSAQQLRGASGNGVAHLDAAAGSRLTIGEEYSHSTSAAATTCTSNDTSVSCPSNPNAGHAGYVECTAEGWTQAKTEQLAGVACLLDTDQVYPGALLQGQNFDGGSFAPITIARSGGTITLAGLSLSAGSSYSRTLSEITYANVTDAIQDILTAGSVTGTAANASYRVDEAYSASQWAFELGVDASMMSTDLSAAVGVSSDTSENTVILTFTQVYYTVSFADPSARTDVFKAGANFDDPENQIGQGNPPLYVSNVKYGRQVFFIAQSSYGAQYIEAALNGAYTGAASTVKVDSSLTYQDVMANTSITYIVRGGDAGLALAPIAAASPAEMYDKVKDFLAGRESANFSASSPGVPVAYTLRYLQDRTTAMRSYSTTYDQNDCRTYPAQDYQLQLHVNDLDDDVYVWCDSTSNNRVAYTNGSSYNGTINNWLSDDNDHTIIIWVGNGNCFGTSAKLSVTRDGSTIWSYNYTPGGWSTCGWQVQAELTVNRATGAVSQKSLWHYK